METGVALRLPPQSYLCCFLFGCAYKLLPQAGPKNDDRNQADGASRPGDFELAANAADGPFLNFAVPRDRSDLAIGGIFADRMIAAFSRKKQPWTRDVAPNRAVSRGG
jgi:hypothetical protein